jgi:hypothetical protein
MTPRQRGDLDDEGGYQTNRSNQLTGIKPKALQFISPVKPTPAGKTMASASTKEGTTGLRNNTAELHQTFGLSNCMFKCE